MKKSSFDSTWYFGANFIPSNAVNQLEMWQEDTFSPELIKKELTYAKNIGMNIMRVYLHNLLWEQDAEGFLARMEKYLEISDSLGIKTMFVLFDDCWNDEAKLGTQPEPKPNTHNSRWVKSPSTHMADDLSKRPTLEKYIKGVLNHFKNDERIVAWDLYNEPGNGTGGDHVTKTGLRENASLPLLKDVFAWAKEVNPSQPVTSAPWFFVESFSDLNRYSFENSEIVSFHCYNKPEDFKKVVEEVKKVANGRPIICTEYMARQAGCFFADILPMLKENNISAINWGLVAGKTQTYLPWSSMMNDLSMPFHDVFDKDGNLLFKDDKEAFDKIAK